MPKNLSKRPIINFLILVVALEIIVISINFSTHQLRLQQVGQLELQSC